MFSAGRVRFFNDALSDFHQLSGACFELVSLRQLTVIGVAINEQAVITMSVVIANLLLRRAPDGANKGQTEKRHEGSSFCFGPDNKQKMASLNEEEHQERLQETGTVTMLMAVPVPCVL